MLDYAAIQVSLKGWMRTEPATEKELEYAAKIPSGMYEVYSNKLDVALERYLFELGFHHCFDLEI